MLKSSRKKMRERKYKNKSRQKTCVSIEIKLEEGKMKLELEFQRRAALIFQSKGIRRRLYLFKCKSTKKEDKRLQNVSLSGISQASEGSEQKKPNCLQNQSHLQPFISF